MSWCWIGCALVVDPLMLVNQLVHHTHTYGLKATHKAKWCSTINNYIWNSLKYVIILVTVNTVGRTPAPTSQLTISSVYIIAQFFLTADPCKCVRVWQSVSFIIEVLDNFSKMNTLCGHLAKKTVILKFNTDFVYQVSMVTNHFWFTFDRA